MRRRIVVYGATGRTGQLIAAELAGTDHVLLSARDDVALARVGEEAELPTAPATIDGLRGVLTPGDVLVSAVGPYDLVGDAVVEAAIDAAATYVDVAGETAFLDRLYRRHGPRAARRGVTLLPAVGYESLPGHLVAGDVLTAVGDDAVAVEIAYLADGGPGVGSASSRRSLARALTHGTTTYRERQLRREGVGARRSSFDAGGRRWSTVSVGGAEVWTLPARVPGLRSVDVHAAWPGPLGPLLQVSTRVTWPARVLGVDRVVDEALKRLGDWPAAGLSTGTSRFVARARDRSGVLLARREAAGGDPVVVAARLAAATADHLARRDLRDVPVGATDPISVLGHDGVADVCGWAGVVLV